MKNYASVFEPKDLIWQGLTLTEEAAKHIRYLSNKKELLGIRLSVKKSGCAGLSYVIEAVNASENNCLDRDLIYERNGARLYVSLKVMPFVDGTTIDYVQEGLSQFFKFDNPKMKNECGCGESFGIEVES